MEYNTTMNTPISLDKGKFPCDSLGVERKRTIQDNLMETSDILTSIEAQIDRIRKFIWSKDDENNGPSIEVLDMDSNIVHNLDSARRIYEKLTLIVDRLGC